MPSTLARAAQTVCALLLCASVAAAPAAWHVWRSKSKGTTVCAQVSPGAGWERVAGPAAGPYRDARCEQPGRPGS